MAEIKTNGIILRRADYKDFDRMVTIFSPNLGKIDAIARGCRRPKSPLMNATDPFTSGEFLLFQKGDRFTLEQCRITESYYDLRMDYDRLKHGAYWLKLLDASVMPDVPMEHLFLKTIRALAYLSYSPIEPELLTMVFEMHLMAESGLSPNVEVCSRCGRTINEDSVFDPISGTCRCMPCSNGGIRLTNGARRTILKTPRTSFDKVELLSDYPYWKEAARILRTYVDDRIQVRKFAPPLAEE